MARFAKLTSFMLFWIVVFSSQSFAFLRFPLQDAEVVERSEVIVVGHLVKDSIKIIKHKTGPDSGASWEHHAVIAVSEVLKGKLKEKKIPIVILHGMDIKVDGRFFRKGPGHRSPGNPKNAIEIWDTGSSSLSFKPTVKDAGKDLIWFLRGGVRNDRTVADKSSFGIADPEVMQPLRLKDYFLAYLSDDPEKAVKEQVAKNPEIKERAKRYFDHMAIQRIIRNKDTKIVVEQLLPYYLGRETLGRCEARVAIAKCGEVAAPYLLEIFKNAKKDYLRGDIIRMWAEMKYRDCVPLLISLLEEHDKFWAKQKLEKGWWNSDKDSERRKKRRQIYGEVYYSVYALGNIGDPSAIPAIALTKNRWESIKFDNPQIIEECTRTMKKLAIIKSGNFKHKGPIVIKTPEIIRLLEKAKIIGVSIDHSRNIHIRLKDGSSFIGKYVHAETGKYANDKELSDGYNLVMHIKRKRDLKDVENWIIKRQ